MIRFDVVTLFPEMFTAVAGSGITGRALEAGLWSLTTWNPRDFTTDRYRTVDERPYGGGPGMVMLAEPLERALDAVAKRHAATQAQVALAWLMTRVTAPIASATSLTQLADIGKAASLKLTSDDMAGLDKASAE